VGEGAADGRTRCVLRKACRCSGPSAVSQAQRFKALLHGHIGGLQSTRHVVQMAEMGNNRDARFD
jgi:hypothetical protein